MAGRQSQEQLSAQISAAEEKVTIGAKYWHYKRKEDLYVVLNIAILEATDESCVIYQAEYGDQVIFVRPLQGWLETLDVAGLTTPRFGRAGTEKADDETSMA